MRTASLERTSTGDTGTFGLLTLDDGFQCYTIELPWRNDLADVSCIPPGMYICSWGNSPKHGPCYYVNGVPDGRTNVEIHSANFAGDISLGYMCQLEGCIALGTAVGKLYNQQAVLNSKPTVAAFNADLNTESFTLTITESY